MKPSQIAYPLFLSMVGASLAAAQSNSARLQPSCGDAAVHFDVQTKKAEPQDPDDSTKVEVYVIEKFVPLPWPNSMWDKPIIRVGLDGQWIGATQGNSYAVVPVQAGEHHVCVQRQSALGFRARQAAFASFKAEAGRQSASPSQESARCAG